MKFIVTLLAFSIFAEVCNADCLLKANAANIFINEYKNYCDDYYNHKTSETRDSWVKRNSNVTDSFKVSYKKLNDDAEKEDPEIGLDYDPIFYAQDYPDLGFEVFRCDEKSNFVTLKAVGGLFKVVVKTIKTDKGWLIDGAGIINIPLSEYE